MMDGRCATCKWWEPFNAGWTPPSMSYIKRDGGEWRLCKLVEADPNAYGDEPEHAGTLAFLDDHHACLSTRADFGCVQWEKREE